MVPAGHWLLASNFTYVTSLQHLLHYSIFCSNKWLLEDLEQYRINSTPTLLYPSWPLASLLQSYICNFSTTSFVLFQINDFHKTWKKDTINSTTTLLHSSWPLASCLQLYICNFSPTSFGLFLFLFQINDFQKTWNNIESILHRHCFTPAAEYWVLCFNCTYVTSLQHLLAFSISFPNQWLLWKNTQSILQQPCSIPAGHWLLPSILHV